MLPRSILSFCASFVVLANQSVLAAPPPLQQCVFEWEVKARGIVAGTMHDTVTVGPTASTVMSVFTPSGLAALLGAPKVHRTWTRMGAFSEREETKTNRGEVEKNHWIAKGGQLWKVDEKNARQEQTPPQGLMADAKYIDSTVFPYLDLVGPRFGQGHSDAWVLNQSEPYPAQVTRAEDTLQYRAKNKRGTIWVADGKPVRMQFSEKNDTFNAQVVSSHCT